MTTLPLSFELVPSTDIPTAIRIEQSSFPPDEAGSLSTFQSRQSQAPSLFLGAYLSPSHTLIGYICSTLTTSSTLTHESMSTHIPGASFVAIHSVCVDLGYRHKGVATALLEEYQKRLGGMSGVKGGRLIAHKELVGLYQSTGWVLVGKSEVVHGEREWFELKMDFDENEEEEEEVGRNPGKRWKKVRGELKDDEGRNLSDLYCPRLECGSLILRKGSARWVEAREGDFTIPPLPLPTSTSTTPQFSSPTPSTGYWSVSSPLTFENIGFSRNVSSSPSATPTIKFLICADCDHGPLGYHDTQGHDLGLEVERENEGVEGGGRSGRSFWLGAERVRYRI